MTQANTSTKSSRHGAEILCLEKVVRRFGNNVAVNELSFSLHAGEVLALLGPNGAGKTTTVEMCEGFSSPDEGTVRVFGMDPVAKADAVRERIGVMLQGGGAYPGVRVGEMLELVASYSTDPLDTQWLLETVGLASHKKTPYRRLSGGQQQRLSLACALVNRPELVFLDEPTAGLDAQSRMVVWDLVRSLRRDGVAVVLTTHLMDEAEALADNVVIIDKGRVVAQGSPEQLTSMRVIGGDSAEGNAGGMVTIHYDGDLAAEELAAQLRQTGVGKEAVSVSETKAQHLAIKTKEVTPEFIATLTQLLADKSILLRSLDVNKQTLEDVFLNITGREIRS
ncbi:ABC transporter ATP-binding protein [Corynebacterium anserum]|uniref:ABC transporter ATP-binding protein n=1 Tax=Corynebacterium anserum TaxID=2684406 RepID=UPI001FE66806|nr:ABC transporter ATP-binding protein [Corynebacterium anserum]